jgi:hypothetical protein
MVLREVIAGVVVVHIIWVASYIMGALLLRAIDHGNEAGGRLEDGIDLVLATALGMAFITLGLYMLGTAGLLNPVACSTVWALAVAALVTTLRAGGASPGTIVSALTKPLSLFRNRAILVLYVIAIVESVPAVLPPTEWDTTMYHLPNAIDWARTGRIYNDPFLRAPYFAFNFELFSSLAFVFHLNRFVIFVGWLPFVCSALCIQVMTTWLLSRNILPGPTSARYCNVLGFTTGLAFLANPLVLHYAVVGYVDVAVGFFLLAASAALLRSLDRFPPYALIAGIIGGSLIGMKLQLILFIPLILGSLLYAARTVRAPCRALVIAVIAFAIFASPWYVRNAILTGDPISPTLNVMLGHTDPVYNRVDYEGFVWNLHYGTGTIFSAPIDFFLNKPFLDDWGTSLSVALIGLMPLAALLVVVFRRAWQIKPQVLLLSGIAAYSMMAILVVSLHIERYLLTYFPIFLVALMLAIVAILKMTVRHRRGTNLMATTGVGVAIMLGLASPEPMAAVAYQGYTSRLADVGLLAASSPSHFLAVAGGGDFEAEDLAQLLASSGASGNVLAFRYENTAYYFRAQGIVSLGDWFGPARYADLHTALLTGHVPAYFQRFKIDGVLIGPSNPGWSPQDLAGLLKAIKSLGFVEVTMDGHRIREFLRPDAAARVDPALLAGVKRVNGVVAIAPDTVDFVREFPRGTISSTRKLATPTGSGAFLYSWPKNDVSTQTVTVLSGISYRFQGIRFGEKSSLSVDVAKPFSEGKPAIAWIDVTAHGQRRRILSLTCDPKGSGEIVWHHVEVPLASGATVGSITFGASSIPGGGVADWIVFANPLLTHASLAEK